jgi:hypothetical protein
VRVHLCGASTEVCLFLERRGELRRVAHQACDLCRHCPLRSRRRRRSIVEVLQGMSDTIGLVCRIHGQRTSENTLST